MLPVSDAIVQPSLTIGFCAVGYFAGLSAKREAEGPAFSTADIEMIQSMAYAVLPRRYGKPGALEKFARQAVEQSYSKLGAMLMPISMAGYVNWQISM